MSAADVLRIERAERMLRRAVKVELDHDEDRDSTRPMRLRGLVHTEEAKLTAVTKLLISKGVFTRNEYEAELATAMENAAADAVAYVRQRLSYTASTNFDDPP